MSEIHFSCPKCGKHWRASSTHAGRQGTCQHCGEPVRVPAPVAQKAKPRKQGVHTAVACATLCLFGGIALAGMQRSLAERQRMQASELANHQVVERVLAARTCLESRQWDQAEAILNDAIALENATDVAAAQALLEQVRKARAEAQAEAERRRQDEARRREELLQQQREGRVRATPLFQEVRAFVVQAALEMRQAAGENEALVAYVIRELKVTDPKEQQTIRRQANRRDDVRAALEQRVAQLRADVKQRFRPQQSDEQERAAFEKAVDQELEPLTEVLKRE